MTKQTCIRILFLILALGSSFPSMGAPPQVNAVAADELPARLLDYDFQQVPLAAALQQIAGTECPKVIFDDSASEYVNSTRIALRLTKASPARALSILVGSTPLSYEYTDDGELVIFRGAAPEKVKLINIAYSHMSLGSVIKQISEVSGLRIRLHSSAAANRDARVTIDLEGVSLLRGLELILNTQRLTYEYNGCGTIIIFQDESARLT